MRNIFNKVARFYVFIAVRRVLWILLSWLFCGSLLCACSNLKDSDRKLDLALETSAGDATFLWLQKHYGVLRNEQLDGLLQRLYERLSTGALIACHSETLPCRFPEVWYSTVLDTPTPTAFSAVGGRLFLSKGIILKLHREDELAAVISHEMAHHLLGHLSAALEKSIAEHALNDGLDTAPRSMFSLDEEIAADALGARILYWSAYQPKAALEAITIAYELPEVAGAQESPIWLRERTARLFTVVRDLPNQDLSELPSRNFIAVQAWLRSTSKAH